MSIVSSEPSVPPTISGAPIIASRTRTSAGAIAARTGSDAAAGSASSANARAISTRGKA